MFTRLPGFDYILSHDWLLNVVCFNSCLARKSPLLKDWDNLPKHQLQFTRLSFSSHCGTRKVKEQMELSFREKFQKLAEAFCLLSLITCLDFIVQFGSIWYVQMMLCLVQSNRSIYWFPRAVSSTVSHHHPGSQSMVWLLNRHEITFEVTNEPYVPIIGISELWCSIAVYC